MPPFEGIVRLATPADSPGIVDLLRRCYAGTYCIPDALDADAVARSIEAGRACYALAIGPGGDPVGQAAMLRVGPAGLFEVARVVVDPAFRDRGLMRTLTRRVQFEEAAGLGARVVYAGAVTSHLAGQQNGRGYGLTPMGLYLGIYPPSVRAVGVTAPEQPISSLVFGNRVGELEARPRRLCLEGADAAHAGAVLRGLRIPSVSCEPGSDEAPVRWALRAEPSIGLEHLSLGGAQDEEVETLDELLAARAEARVVWADVPSEHPRAAELALALRERGFGLAAYLPLAGPAGEDVLRLQRWQDDVILRREAIHVLPEYETLRDLVLADCLGVGVA